MAGGGVAGIGVAGAGARGQPAERRFGLTDFVSLFRRRLGQQLWLMCKLAFMVGVFSSNNASWRRIFVLCLAAAGIFCMFHLILSFSFTAIFLVLSFFWCSCPVSQCLVLLSNMSNGSLANRRT